MKCFLLSLLLLSPVFGATTYYLDSNGGNDANSGTAQDKAWKTLKKISETKLTPGDKVLFVAGSKFTGMLKLTGAGSKTSPVIVGVCGKGDRPRIDGSGVLDTVLVSNMQYVEISGLEITNKGPDRKNWRIGIRVQASSSGTLKHIVLRDLYVHDVNGSLNKGTEGCGIYVEAKGKVKSRFDGLLIEKCRVVTTDRNGICMRSSFIKRKQNWYPSLNVVIRKNLIEDCGGDCIKPWGCDGALVEHNVIRGGRMRCKDHAAGIWPWSCDNTLIQFNEVSGVKGTKDGQSFDCDYNCYNTLIQYNYSYNNEGGFLLVCGPKPKGGIDGTVNSVIRYNVSYNDGYSGERIFHISGGGVKGTRIYNNVIYVKKRPGQKMDNILVKMDNWGGYATDTLFQNNIFYAEGTVSYSWGKAKKTVFQNNCYYGKHQSLPKDARAIMNDPMFVSPAGGKGFKAAEGFRLKPGSKCIGKAMKIEKHGGRDFSGKTIGSDGPNNLGAFE